MARVAVQSYGLVIPAPRRLAFIGGTGVLLRVDLASRHVKKVRFEMRAEWSHVPFFDAVTTTGDGARLVVALGLVDAESSSAGAVQSFALPGLSPNGTVDPTPLTHLIGGPDGTVLLFPMADSPPPVWKIYKLDVGTGSMTPLLVLPGPVARIVTSQITS